MTYTVCNQNRLYCLQYGHNTIDVSSSVFVSLIPGKRLLPNFKVEVGYPKVRYRTCKQVQAPRTYSNIGVQCTSHLRGRRVKITTLKRGRLSLCEMAIYGTHGKYVLFPFNVNSYDTVNDWMT